MQRLKEAAEKAKIELSGITDNSTSTCPLLLQHTVAPEASWM